MCPHASMNSSCDGYSSDAKEVGELMMYVCLFPLDHRVVHVRMCVHLRASEVERK